MKDTIEITSLQRTLFKAPKMGSHIVLIHVLPQTIGQPLYSGQISWSQCVLYKEAYLLYVQVNKIYVLVYKMRILVCKVCTLVYKI